MHPLECVRESRSRRLVTLSHQHSWESAAKVVDRPDYVLVTPAVWYRNSFPQLFWSQLCRDFLIPYPRERILNEEEDDITMERLRKVT